MKTEDCTTFLGHRVATRNLNRIILLPLELKQRICNYLTPKDLKFLRLALRDHAIFYHVSFFSITQWVYLSTSTGRK